MRTNIRTNMKNTKKYFKGINMYAMGVLLLVCTIVSVYGILTAPQSDQAELEQELKHNEQTLQQIAFTPSATEKRKDDKKKNTRTISVIGDSVFLGAAPAFQQAQKNVVIDAKISRQVYHGLDVARQLNKKGKLGDTVIISLGTNGKFNPATGQELIDYLGRERTIYWVNVYGKNIDWQNSVNKTIRELAEKNENVHVISWAKKARKHPDWFYQDGTHLNGAGQDGFSQFIKHKLDSPT